MHAATKEKRIVSVTVIRTLRNLRFRYEECVIGAKQALMARFAHTNAPL
jgi:hypothetical protein